MRAELGDLDTYLALIEEERECRPAEAMLADEIKWLRTALAKALSHPRLIPLEGDFDVF